MKQIIIEPKELDKKFDSQITIGGFVTVKITKAVPFKLFGKIVRTK